MEPKKLSNKEELKKISDKDLLVKTKTLAAQERELLVEILHHLKEIDTRKLYLEIGYPSLWAYCTQELNYSEGSAQRRIEAMRALKEMPVLEKKIESGELSLSNVARAQSVLRRCDGGKVQVEKKLGIFSLLENKSQKETEQTLAVHFPEEIKKIERLRPVTADLTEIRLTASHQLVEKLEKIKNLFSHKNPNASLAETLELMADFVIAKKDFTQATKSQTSEKTERTNPPPQRRYSSTPRSQRQATTVIEAKGLSSSTRRLVWQRAHGKCEYTDKAVGRRCNGQHKLEIEHVMPRAFGGGHEPDNLKLYCRAHNMLTAKQATLI